MFISHFYTFWFTFFNNFLVFIVFALMILILHFNNLFLISVNVLLLSEGLSNIIQIV